VGKKRPPGSGGPLKNDLGLYTRRKPGVNSGGMPDPSRGHAAKPLAAKGKALWSDPGSNPGGQAVPGGQTPGSRRANPTPSSWTRTRFRSVWVTENSAVMATVASNRCPPITVPSGRERRAWA